jgi:hypothetical protein
MTNEFRHPQSTDRRDFLRRVSGTIAAAGAVVPAVAAGQGSVSQPAAGLLPTIPLGKYQVTRLITGWNPIGGHSHQTLNASLHMLEYFTPERTFEFITQCEAAGINTWQLDHTEKSVAVVRRLREKGSKMQIICLHSETPGHAPLKTAAADLGAIAFVHHGRVAYNYFHSGKSAIVRDYVKKVHDLGLLAGVSIQDPDDLKRITDEGWENEFFMTSFHNLSRPAEEQRRLFGTVACGEPFFETDPPAMTKVMREVAKPCLAYKILAAGRRSLSPRSVTAAAEKGFKYAFANIKPTDAVIVGIFPVYRDELGESVAFTRKYGTPAS